MLPAEIPGFYLLKKNTIGSNIGWDDQYSHYRLPYTTDTEINQ